VRSCSGYDFSEAAGITASAWASSPCPCPSPRSSSHVQSLILSAMRSGLSQIVCYCVPHGFLSVSLVGLDGLGLDFPSPSAIVNVNHNPRAWICQAPKMRFFSRLRAAKLARAGRRPHAQARGNGLRLQLLDAVLAAVVAAVGSLEVGDEVGSVTSGWSYWLGLLLPTPPSETDRLAAATGCRNE
jgi:hypothetical protein